MNPVTVENYAPPSVGGALRVPQGISSAPSAVSQGISSAEDAFKDLGGGRAECHSKNGRTHQMRYAAFDGGRVVTSCECESWGFDGHCRHGDQFNLRLAAQDAAEERLVAEYPGLRSLRSAVQERPCADCGGLAVSATLYGLWPCGGGGEALAYWPHAKIVCGCGVRDGGRVR